MYIRKKKIRWSLLIYLLLQVLIASGITPEKLRFKHLTEENGLTNSYINCIGQDRNGFIWFGSENGLYRYDGYRFKHYLNLPGDTNSINSNTIFKLYTDTHHNLWVGTFMGIMRYDEEYDSFHDFNLSTDFRDGYPVPTNGITEDTDSTVIISTDLGAFMIDPVNYTVKFIRSGSPGCLYAGNKITAYLIDREGNHWIGTEEGVSRIDATTSEATFYDLSRMAHTRFTTTFINDIFQDSEQNIWIVTREEGVFKKSRSSDKFRQYYYNENDKNSLGSNETYDIYEDETGQVWISTNGGGLNLYNVFQDNFIRIKHAANEKNSLLNNNPRSIFEDFQGNIWIASYQAGVNIYINHPQLFRYYDINSDQPIDYQSSTVCSIYQYDDDKLWIGTDGGGLKLLDRNTGVITTFLPDKNISGSFPDKVVMTIYKDRYNDFWFGTYQGGLVKYDKKNQKFYASQNNPSNPYSISNNFVTSILEDKRGNFWIGTSGGGLNLYDRDTKEFRAYLHSPDDTNSLVDNSVNDILEDHNGNLWIGTYWGLSRFDAQESRFYNYHTEKTNNFSLSHNSVFVLFEDSKNRLWIGTRNGVNLYNSEEDRFYYLSVDGLSGCSVYGILEDNQNNLWISSNKGIFKFNPELQKVINFTDADGLQGNEFFRKSCYKGAYGELFFGGINGFNAFFAEKVEQREYIPNVVITHFRIFDKEVPIGEMEDGRIILKRSICKTSRVQLRYSDKVFSFEVAAPDFITPENMVIAYKMDGFDEGWNYVNAQYPVITYTNLSAGEYTLTIKAANRNIIDQVDRCTQLHIKITPPFWKSWWAYLSYIFLSLLIAFIFWQITLQRIKEREQVRLEIIKREKAEELNQAKLRFFTNISHEFRTPLTLIIGPLEQLLRRGKEIQPFQKQFNIMLKNARRMLRLINQLLDFRKIEGGKMTLKTEYSDIVKFITDIMHSFEEYTVEKQINFKFLAPVDHFMLWFDPDKMDKILFNLISNAFKFTSPKDAITISIKTGIKSDNKQSGIKEYLQISVSDTGKGIPEKDLPYLFDRFYQAGNTDTQFQGSGLGLSLTKNFIEIHQGKINVESSPAGTSFTILLPVGDTHLDAEQKIIPESPGVNKYIHLSPETVLFQNKENNDRPVQYLHNKPTILLVEDNLELRQYLENEIHDHYNFYGAPDGSEGYEMAVDILPDLIISDIMMPVVNGFEFCQKIKQNMTTSHIPVILLTAKTSTENQIKGFESGADAYIPKPFNIEQLIATANSLIENRIRLREKFNVNKVLSDLPVKNTADDKFLQKVTDTIKNNISEVNFGVLELSREVGISRVHLHRKLKSIANVSPNEFIKTIRLQKARELLLQMEFTISEVCYKVGFNSPAYFSSCFKSCFQMSPSEFIESNLQK